MAFATITLTNGYDLKRVPLGFSWTTVFFGFFVPLYRQAWATALLWPVFVAMTFGIGAFIAPFVYNKIYAKSLFAQGYRVLALPPECTPDQVRVYLGYFRLPHFEES